MVFREDIRAVCVAVRGNRKTGNPVNGSVSPIYIGVLEYNGDGQTDSFSALTIFRRVDAF